MAPQVYGLNGVDDSMAPKTATRKKTLTPVPPPPCLLVPSSAAQRRQLRSVGDLSGAQRSFLAATDPLPPGTTCCSQRWQNSEVPELHGCLGPAGPAR